MFFTITVALGTLFVGFVIGYSVKTMMEDSLSSNLHENESTHFEQTRKVQQFELQELLESDHEYIEADLPDMVPRSYLDASYAEINELKAHIEELQKELDEVYSQKIKSSMGGAA